jgi:hypothetical protein
LAKIFMSEVHFVSTIERHKFPVTQPQSPIATSRYDHYRYDNAAALQKVVRAPTVSLAIHNLVRPA